MKHQIRGSKLGRSASERNSLRRIMMNQMIEHERIKTTASKAKFVRSDLEKLITVAKHGLKANADESAEGRAKFVHAHRLAAARLNNPDMVRKLFETIAPRYAERPGGYTRVLKLGTRRGDAAEMVLLEMVEE